MDERVTWDRGAYAGFWRRTGGLLIDLVILWLAQTMVAFVLTGGAMVVLEPDDRATGGWLVQLVLVAIPLVYEVSLTRARGCTVGERLVGVEMRTEDGSLPSVAQLVGRWFARVLSAFALGLGFLWAAWDPKRQTWQDKLAGTYVVVSERTSRVGGGRTPTPASTATTAAPRSPGAVAASADRPPSPGGTAPTGPPDLNVGVIAATGLDQAERAWLTEVAGRVDERLDRVEPGWRTRPQADTLRGLVFGLLLGTLAARHPEQRPHLARVAEAHPSFASLLAGSRLDTLEQIASDPIRVRAWVGHVLDVDDPERLRLLTD